MERPLQMYGYVPHDFVSFFIGLYEDIRSLSFAMQEGNTPLLSSHCSAVAQTLLDRGSNILAVNQVGQIFRSDGWTLFRRGHSKRALIPLKLEK